MAGASIGPIGGVPAAIRILWVAGLRRSRRADELRNQHCGWVSPGRHRYRRILNGAKPADLPVVQSSNIELAAQRSKPVGHSDDLHIVIGTRCGHGLTVPAHCRDPKAECRRPARVLYAPYIGHRICLFSCSKCTRITYQSTMGHRWDRSARRVEKLRARLQWGAGDTVPIRPRGMHKRTYQRILGMLAFHEAVRKQGASYARKSRPDQHPDGIRLGGRPQRAHPNACAVMPRLSTFDRTNNAIA